VSLETVVDAASFSSADKNKLASLIQAQKEENDDGELGAPKAVVYERSRSNQVIEVIEDLLDKAKVDLNRVRKDEMDRMHNFNMLKQSNEDRSRNSASIKANAEANLADCKDLHLQSTSGLSEVKQLLKDGEDSAQYDEANCANREQTHQETMASYKKEQEAIQTALAHLREKTGGSGNLKYGASFLQLAGSNHARSTNTHIVALLTRLAQENHAPEIGKLASRISSTISFAQSSGEDVFGKVKDMISEMIKKLTSEAAGDASKKAWCDDELAKAQEKKNDLSTRIGKTDAKIGEVASTITKLKEDIEELSAELQELVADMAEMKKIRDDESKENADAIAEFTKGLEGVKAAISALTEFYKTGEGEANTGKSIIGMLEVVESDFMLSRENLKRNEEEADATYRSVLQKKMISENVKKTSKDHSQKAMAKDNSLKAELDDQLNGLKDQLSGVQDSLDRLEDACVEKAETYGDRKARRERELAGLRKALEFLSNDVDLVQEKKAPRRKFLAM